MPIRSTLSLAEHLKQSTASEHAALEKLFMQRLKSIGSYADYARFLEHLAQFIWPVEHAIAQQPIHTIITDAHQRRRGLALVADLNALGRPQPAVQHELASFVHNEYAAAGALYVLEGSALGGAIIGTRILPKQGITEHLSYFLAGSDGITESWKNFKDELDQGVPASNYQEVVEAAATTFKQFGHWLST